jgi:molybdopterin-binding protein
MVQQLTQQVGMLEADLQREIRTGQEVTMTVRRTLLQKEGELQVGKEQIAVRAVPSVLLDHT